MLAIFDADGKCVDDGFSSRLEASVAAIVRHDLRLIDVSIERACPTHPGQPYDSCEDC